MTPRAVKLEFSLIGFLDEHSRNHSEEVDVLDRVRPWVETVCSPYGTAEFVHTG